MAMRTTAWLAIMCALTACSLIAPSHHAQLTPKPYSALPGWQEDDHAAAFTMFVQNCGIVLARKTPYQPNASQPVGDPRAWRDVCQNAQALQRLDSAKARLFFERHFTPHYVHTEAFDTGLFTGYYEPVLRGSFVESHQYSEPVYGVPKN